MAEVAEEAVVTEAAVETMEETIIKVVEEVVDEAVEDGVGITIAIAMLASRNRGLPLAMTITIIATKASPDLLLATTTRESLGLPRDEAITSRDLPLVTIITIEKIRTRNHRPK